MRLRLRHQPIPVFDKNMNSKFFFKLPSIKKNCKQCLEFQESESTDRTSAKRMVSLRINSSKIEATLSSLMHSYFAQLLFVLLFVVLLICFSRSCFLKIHSPIHSHPTIPLSLSLYMYVYISQSPPHARLQTL